jgi:uncharacterized metal-binding protein
MASGHTHDRITQICLPIVAAGGWAILRNGELTIWLAGSFLFSGLMFGPDLDIHSVQSLRWGYFRWLWQPYRQSVPHRSLLSHGPIIGTLGRVFYLALWLGLGVLVVQGFRQAMGWPTWNEQQYWEVSRRWAIERSPHIWTVLVGLELGAMTHYLADVYSSVLKKAQKKRSPSTQPKRKKLAR